MIERLKSLITDSPQQNIFSTIKKLGDCSDRSFVILETTNYSIIHCNEQYERLTNRSREQLIGQPIINLIQDPLKHLNTNDILFQITNGKITKFETYHLRGKASSFYSEFECFPFLNEQDELTYLLIFIRDASMTQAEKLLQNIEKQLFTAIEKGHSIEKKLVTICKEIDSFYQNYTFTAILLKESDQNLLSICSQSDQLHELEPVFLRHSLTDVYEKSFSNATPSSVSVDYHSGLINNHVNFALNKNMNTCFLYPIINQNDEIIGLFSLYFTQTDTDDVALENQSGLLAFQKRVSSLISLAYTFSVSQQRIHQLEYTDMTTGLDNRTQFVNKLKIAIQERKSGYIKILEPGEFSNVVELYGRNMGDSLLKQIADRFKQLHGMENVYMARFSSSSLILYRVTPEDNLEHIKFNERIRDLLHNPYMLGDKKIYITLKTGIAPFNSQVNAKEAIQNSENALSFARKQLGTYSSMFTEERKKELERQVQIVNHLNLALQRDEIAVHLQPKINIKSNQIYAFEALARWHSPEIGFVSPAEFIPAAESTGKIQALDSVIISKVLTWLKQRKLNNKKTYPVAVNISPEHFYQADFVEDLEALIYSFGLQCNDLIIEVTENISLVDLEKAIEIMSKLKNLGFHISMDDFGVGFSSLSYLQKFPFDELKIDQIFTRRLHEHGTKAIVRSIIQIAQSLQMNVVAEGVETEEQENTLVEIGCQSGQGYKYYKPLPIHEIDNILENE